MDRLCALRGHRLRWHAYTWEREDETVTLNLGRCWCGENAQAEPIKAVPKDRLFPDMSALLTYLRSSSVN